MGAGLRRRAVRVHGQRERPPRHGGLPRPSPGAASLVGAVAGELTAVGVLFPVFEVYCLLYVSAIAANIGYACCGTTAFPIALCLSIQRGTP